MNRTIPLIGLIVAMLLTAVFWFVMYQPQNERQRALEAQVLTLREQEQTLQARVAALQAIRDDEVAIRAALARLEEYIPTSVAQPSALRQLQRIADASGTTLEILRFGDAAPPQATGETTPVDTGEPGKVLAAIPVTIAVDGGYFQIVDFLRRLEVDLPRAVLVQDLALEKSPDGNFPRLRATLTSQLFAIIDAEQLPTAQAAAPGGTPAPAPTPTPSPTPSPS